MNASKEALKMIVAFAIVTAAGCAQLKPAAIHLEASHLSHLTQHWPFTDHPTAWGTEYFGAGLRWEPVKNTSITVLESYVPFHGLDGMSEAFTARVTYEIPLK